MATSRRMLTEKEIKALGGGGGGSMETVDTIISIDDGFKVTYADGSNLDLPLKAGNGISMDVSEDGYSIEVKAEGGSGGLYQHRITFELGGVSGPPDEQLFIWLVDDYPDSYDIITFKDKYCTIDAWETQKIINGSKQLPLIKYSGELHVIGGIRMKTSGSTNNINLYLGGNAVANRTHDLNDLNVVDAVVEL